MYFRLVLNFCRVGQGILWRVMGVFLNNYFLNARKIRRAIIGLEIGTSFDDIFFVDFFLIKISLEIIN